jgi:transcriptional regulator with PAS, ATPase and Fis domain
MIFNTEGYVKKFTDMMSEGLIVIDHESKIQIYNEKAKEIFGINHVQQISHDRGVIKSGDIVIIGDNSIGRDDGNLNSKALECLGIYDGGIEKGDALIAIGIFNEAGVSPVYEILKSNHLERTFKLKTEFLDIEIGVVIDFLNKIITIEVDREKFSMNYINAIGHMVILDGKTKVMKFYQSQGYTARDESLNNILKGKKYRGKGQDSELLNVIGKDIFKIHKGSKTIQEFYEVAKGKDISYLEEFKEINGFPTMCTLLPVNDEENNRIGAALKVEDISEIKRVIRERDDALQDLEKIEKQLKEEVVLKEAFPKIIGDSPGMEHVKKLALKASKTNSTVLILGESGTGKTILAKAIHENSKNKDKPFIHVNCGAIPDNLLESELFGYEKGAFTGAKSEGKKGLFEMANEGTIFLDEIGDISLNLQVKLLQVLQDKSFYRVGGIEKVKVNIRVIAATNKNLETEMAEGRFREDLYYRINVFPLLIPPLRERKEDIYPLVETILPKICKEIEEESRRISAEAISLLMKYNWPGNVRELENILERAINLAEGNTILSKHITLNIKEVDYNEDGMIPLREAVNNFEKKAIERVLSFYKGDKKKAMDALKISKTTFYEKLRKYNIE